MAQLAPIRSKILRIIVLIQFLITSSFFASLLNAGNLEFDGITWTEEFHGVGTYNQELQYYSSGNATVDSDGELVLEIERINNGFKSSRINSRYTTINLDSGEKLSVEFEARLPRPVDALGNTVNNTPLWPALWIMGKEVFDNALGWPYCGELDLMEWSPTRYTGPNAFSSAYHWNGADDYHDNYDPSGDNQPYDEFITWTGQPLWNNYHTWRIDIYRYDDGENTNKIELFFDNAVTPIYTLYMDTEDTPENEKKHNQEFWWPTTAQKGSDGAQAFNESATKEYVLIMNIAMGGWYPGKFNVSDVPAAFDRAEMHIRSVDYSITSLNGGGSGSDGDNLTTTIEETLDAQFDGVFGGFLHTASINSYEFPSTADSWAGIANTNSDIYPLDFSDAPASIKFTGSAPNGDVSLRFKFERLPYDDTDPNATEPSFETETITVTGSTPSEYTVNIPEQSAGTTYSSFLLYLNTQNRSVTLSDFQIIQTLTVPAYLLELDYDSGYLSVTKDPEADAYASGTSVLVEAEPVAGYILSDSSWLSKTLLINSTNNSYQIDTDPDLADNDADGITNYKESIILGSNPNLADTDQDGYDDNQEYIAGTDLTNANSYFQIYPSIDSENLFSLDFQSLRNRTYSINVSSDLNQWHLWKTLNGNGRSQSHSFDSSAVSIPGLDSNASNYFFRISIEMSD